jgi:hypothetical protein
MNEEQAQLQRQKLLSECQQLLDEIAQHRLALKLLTAVKLTLEMTINYKANRKR